ncbi:MAG: DUF4837 family protein [Bacteroidales bacterium]|nr:DUF4837 family protein [Bacteroidales bacterium]
MNFYKIYARTGMISLLMLLTIAFSSCERKVRYEQSTGKTNEILVVTNNKTQWNGELGRVVKDFFGQPLPGLPQPEPMFRLFNIADENMNKIFRSQHNILIIDINPGFSEPLVETRTDHWARPQRLIKITAPDLASFKESFEQHKTAFLKAFNELEIKRTNQQFKMARSVKLTNIIKKKFGFDIQLPGGFVIGSEDDQFIWLRQSMHKVKQDVELGIMIYEAPYTDTSVFSPEYILDLRDSLTRKHIPGPSEGSYMITSRDYIPAVFNRQDDFVSGFAVETRGLWMVKNDFMGGPFISFTFTDPGLERVITVDGYVYNPGDLKRNFIRQMEAIFYTISFGGNGD